MEIQRTTRSIQNAALFLENLTRIEQINISASDCIRTYKFSFSYTFQFSINYCQDTLALKVFCKVEFALARPGLVVPLGRALGLCHTVLQHSSRCTLRHVSASRLRLRTRLIAAIKFYAAFAFCVGSHCSIIHFCISSFLAGMAPPLSLSPSHFLYLSLPLRLTSSIFTFCICICSCARMRHAQG